MTPGVQVAFERTIATAATFGATAEVRVPHFAQSVWTDFTILGVEAVMYHERWRDQRALYTPYVRERLADAEATSAVDYVSALQAAAQCRLDLDRALDRCDALIVPGIPFPAPPLGVTSLDVGGGIEDRDTSLCRNTAFANITGHPALALPVGFEAGLPVGVQLVGRRGSDAELLALGEVFADAFATPTLATDFPF